MDSAVLCCAALCCTMDVIPNASEYPVPYLIYVQQQQQQDGACANVWLQLKRKRSSLDVHSCCYELDPFNVARTKAPARPVI